MLAGRIKKNQDGGFVERNRLQGGCGSVLQGAGDCSFPDSRTGRVAGARTQRVGAEEPARVRPVPGASRGGNSQRRIGNRFRRMEPAASVREVSFYPRAAYAVQGEKCRARGGSPSTASSKSLGPAKRMQVWPSPSSQP